MTLKTVIIKGVRIVGMHHYGGRLALEAGYHVRPEPDNPKDKMAVAIKDGERNVGYISRSMAHALFPVLIDVQGIILIRIKSAPEVVNRKQGPFQRGNLGFRVPESEYISICAKLRERGVNAC